MDEAVTLSRAIDLFFSSITDADAIARLVTATVFVQGAKITHWVSVSLHRGCPRRTLRVEVDISPERLRKSTLDGFLPIQETPLFKVLKLVNPVQESARTKTPVRGPPL